MMISKQMALKRICIHLYEAQVPQFSSPNPDNFVLETYRTHNFALWIYTPVFSHLTSNFSFIFFMGNMQLYVFFISLRRESKRNLCLQTNTRSDFFLKGVLMAEAQMVTLAQNSVHSVLIALEEAT